MWCSLFSKQTLNRIGIGFSIVQRLAQQANDNIYLLGARNPEAGEEAIQQLRTAGITSKIEVVGLDITKDASIFEAAAYVEKAYGRLDGKLTYND
jgi:NAD(P)-dependent dehydrogenase (short-subunit alcohol dehydrogenase family)